MTQRKDKTNRDLSQVVSRHLTDDSSDEEGKPSALNAQLFTQQLFQVDNQPIPPTQNQPNADGSSDDEFDDRGLLNSLDPLNCQGEDPPLQQIKYSNRSWINFMRSTSETLRRSTKQLATLTPYRKQQPEVEFLPK